MNGEMITFDEIINLKKLNKAYREGEPIVCDAVYDTLYKQAKEKYPDNKFFEEVGYLSEEFGQDVVLEYHMGSLDNYHYYSDKTLPTYKKGNDIEEWLAKYNDGSGWVMMDKIDGLSIQVTWEMGELSHAELRGDGTVGKDCTDKARIILQHIKIPFHKFVLRGECTLNCDPLSLGYKNRRNGAVGLMKKESLEGVNNLSIYFYEMIEKIDHITLDGIEVNSVQKGVDAQLEYIASLNLPTVRFDCFSTSLPLDVVAKAIDRYGNNIERDLYDADGKVICPNSYTRELDLIPKRKIAFKIHAATLETIVRDIGIQVSRLGKLVPVIYYDPLEIGGATCSKATGFNFEFISQNKIGIGSKILICRSEEVIPYVKGVVESANLSIPEICPECGSNVHWDENHINLVCRNIYCPPQKLKSITHFFISLGLEEFSESSFEKLNLNDIFDVYNLTEEKIKTIEGFGDKSAKDLIKRIKDTLNTKAEFLIQALGINGIGKSLSKLLIKNYSWDDIKNIRFNEEQLIKLPDVGRITARDVIEGLKDRQSLIFQLERIGMVVNETSGNLTGKSFCVTGSLIAMKRNEVEKWIINNGGEITGVKNIQNMYLVCNSPSSSAKYKKAQEYKIPIITEDELFSMVN